MKQGWEIKKIKDICYKESSNIAQNKIVELDGDYPVYGASGFIQNVDFYQRDTNYIGVVKDGSGVGRVNIYPAFSSLLGTLQYILPKNGFHINYVAYALKSLNLSKYASGAAIPHIYFKDYGEEVIPVPPPPVQEQIVSELDLLSGIIEKKREQLKELDTLAQSIFYDMFGDPITNEKGWEVKKLGEVADIVGGSTPKTNIKEYWNGDNYWVTPAELHGTRYISSTERCITDLAVDKAHLTQLPIGTVLLSSRAPIGKVCITRVPMYCNQGFKNIICSNKLNSEYVYQYLIDKTEFLKSLGTGATFKEISKTTTENITIPIPPLPLQRQFASKIEAIEKQKELIKQSISETETLFNARMQHYFN